MSFVNHFYFYLCCLAMLALGGHRPALPGRTKHPRISQ